MKTLIATLTICLVAATASAQVPLMGAGNISSDFTTGSGNVSQDFGFFNFPAGQELYTVRSVSPLSSDSSTYDGLDNFGANLASGGFDRIVPIDSSDIDGDLDFTEGIRTDNTVGITTIKASVLGSTTSNQTRIEYNRGPTALSSGLTLVRTFGGTSLDNVEVFGRLGLLNDGNSQTLVAYGQYRSGDPMNHAHLFADTDFLVDYNDIDGDGYVFEYNAADDKDINGVVDGDAGLMDGRGTNHYNSRVDQQSIDRSDLILATGLPLGTLDIEFTVDPRSGGTANETSAWFNTTTEGGGRIENMSAHYIDATVTVSQGGSQLISESFGLGVRPSGDNPWEGDPNEPTFGEEVFSGDAATVYDYVEVDIAADTTGDPLIDYDPTKWTLTSAADANRDGSVDGLDIGNLVAGFGASYDNTDPLIDGWAMGDFNGDGSVDGLDIGILVANFGNDYSVLNHVQGGLPGAIEGGALELSDLEGLTSVPEPASIALFGLGGLALLRRRRA